MRAECAALLDDPDAPPLSAEQKDGMVDALWSLVSAFVDLAYRTDSVTPLKPENCGQSGIDAPERCVAPAAMVSSPHQHAALNEETSQGAAGKGES